MNNTAMEHTGAGRGNLKTYVSGFILSVVLTAIAFGAVMFGWGTHSTVTTVIFIAAAAQILVHLHYFLHLDFSSEARWNLLALIFAVLTMALFVGGSLWIMHSLNMRM